MVDDNPDFLSMLKFILNKHFVVHSAINAKDSIAKLYEDTYKAIILDVALPDYTGYYVAKKAREICPQTPVVFLTNYNGEITKENAVDSQAELWNKADIAKSTSTLVDKVKNLYE